VAAADYARKSSVLPVEMDPIAIDRFTPMREQLTSGDVAIALRRTQRGQSAAWHRQAGQNETA
jgi:hypothetical protein